MSMYQREIEWRSPLDAFAPLVSAPFAFILHGGEAAQQSDWTFIGAEPIDTIEWVDNVTLLSGHPCAQSPFEVIDRLHKSRVRAHSSVCDAPFGAGLFGYVGYECAKIFEPSAPRARSPYRLPDLAFGVYDALAVYHRTRRRAWLVGRTQTAIARLAERLQDKPVQRHAGDKAAACGSDFGSGEYRQAVRGVIERIRDGEIFQANISQKLMMRIPGADSAFDIFADASHASSAPFGAFISHSSGEIVSLSPERFFRMRPLVEPIGRFDLLVEPIKGTRPRGASADEDRRLAAELMADPKDRAENIMIADLMRNDLSRVCDDGTICEEDICSLLTISNVHHLVSRISGRVREGLTATDVMAALFPCGSITGAPKLQAMTVIAETEKAGRGPYCGAIGYIDDGGGADFSVAIRTAIAEKDEGGLRLSAPVGGGVTLRSDPDAEYDETLAKAAGFLKALVLTEGDFR